jgi:hypothetical protein
MRLSLYEPRKSIWREPCPAHRPVAAQPDINMNNEVVEHVLVEKIEHLENRVKYLESALRAAEAVTLEATLGPLRLRQAVLLYVGAGTSEEFCRKLAPDMGIEVARAASEHLFVLNNAPLPDAERDAFRVVFENGMNRW